MPTNPFTTSNRRQQILVPKELFPRKNAHINGDSSISTSYRRPVKLPLRKHHSFHFQPSQTVAGVLKHEQFQPKQHQQQHQQQQQQHHQNHQQSTKERYKNQGPLVFKPFSEKSAFKPIVPSPKGSNDSEDSNGPNGFDASTMPRICGTSLKRHISNVETFSTNQWQSDNEDNVQQSASTSANNQRRKIHYADLAPLPTSANIDAVHHRNDRNNNSNSNENCDNVDSSGSERQMVNEVSNKRDHKRTNMQQSASSTSSSSAAPSTNATQYATLRFDEVSI